MKLLSALSLSVVLLLDESSTIQQRRYTKPLMKSLFKSDLIPIPEQHFLFYIILHANEKIVYQ